MAENLIPFSISAPGFYGLNLSDSPVDLTANFALEATNCVIDKSGRVACRKGWVAANSVNADLATSNVECIGELVQNDGTVTTLCAGGGFLFKLSGGALVKLAYGGGGVAPVIAANNWKFCQINGIAMFWQRGYDPLIYDPAVSITDFRRLNEKAGTAGTVYQCNEAISAYGRVWAADTSADKNTVVFSDLLAPHVMTGGTAGSLNVMNIWPSGGDEIVALAAHNNYLIIFGKWQTLIYSGASAPSTMTLYDSIVGVGCIARDSVQNTGQDVIFLSDGGLTSLERVIQEKSAPLVSLSKNIQDELKNLVSNETIANIKSGYSATNNFYLLTIPTAQITWCFNTQSRLQDGSYRVTMWNGVTSKAFYETNARKFYMGKPGYLGEYSGYTDRTAQYRMSYYTTWMDFGNPVAISILKKVFMDIVGARNQTLIFKWGYDFIPSQFSSSVTIPLSATSVSEYGTAEYGIGEFGSTLAVNRIGANGSGSGMVVNIGLEAQVVGSQISIQKIDAFAKEGRL